jgi:hypothetical protein
MISLTLHTARFNSIKQVCRLVCKETLLKKGHGK